MKLLSNFHKKTAGHAAKPQKASGKKKKASKPKAKPKAKPEKPIEPTDPEAVTVFI